MTCKNLYFIWRLILSNVKIFLARYMHLIMSNTFVCVKLHLYSLYDISSTYHGIQTEIMNIVTTTYDLDLRNNSRIYFVP